MRGGAGGAGGVFFGGGDNHNHSCRLTRRAGGLQKLCVELWYFRVDLYLAFGYCISLPRSVFAPPSFFSFSFLPFWLLRYAFGRFSADETRSAPYSSSSEFQFSDTTLRNAEAALFAQIYCCFHHCGTQCLYSRSHAPIHKK